MQATDQKSKAVRTVMFYFRTQVQRGWQMMGILVSTFPPSKNLENYLKNFLQANFNTEGSGSFLDTVIRYGYATLTRVCRTGPRGRTMTKAELEQALVIG